MKHFLVVGQLLSVYTIIVCRARRSATLTFAVCTLGLQIWPFPSRVHNILNFSFYINQHWKLLFFRHPELITENFKCLYSYVGIVNATVMLPRRLFHPVLPYRFDGKLLFPLCRTCAEDQIDSCNHSEKERALTGAWVSLEIETAVEKGYLVSFCIYNLL